MGFQVVRSCVSGTAGVKWVNLVIFVLLTWCELLFPTFLGSWRPVDFLSVCLLPALPEFRSLLCVLWLYMQQHLESPVPSLCTWLPKKVVIQSDLNILPFSPSEPPTLFRMTSSFGWACRIVLASIVWPFPQPSMLHFGHQAALCSWHVLCPFSHLCCRPGGSHHLPAISFILQGKASHLQGLTCLEPGRENKGFLGAALQCLFLASL